VAVAGNAKQSIEMAIIDGNLVIGRYAHRVGVIDNVDEAIQKLLDGHRVFVHAYGNKVDLVTKTVRIALGQWPPNFGEKVEEASAETEQD
jgi:hypothetical protein